jgi:hypothetical protein
MILHWGAVFSIGAGAEMGEAPLIVIVSEMAEAMKAAPKPATKAEVLRAGWV